MPPLVRRFGSRTTAARDVRAGVVLGIESVPDGLAAGLLAGVNPVHGLYAYLSGTLAGAVSTSSALMTVQATGAMAVLVSDVPLARDPRTAGPALATLSAMTGIIMLTLGLARLGGLVRFVPHAVLVGFVNAVAVNIVLGQLGSFTGYAATGDNRLVRLLDTLARVTSFGWSTVAVGAVTVALILALERTVLGPLGMVVAVVLASAAAALLHLHGVQVISDIAEVPDALPLPDLPTFGHVGSLLLPALSLAFVGLVQGAAISGSVPNPDGDYPDASGDFRGQGIANLAAGVFQGMPVGGSMSATALARSAGARTALANLTAGVVMALCIVVAGRAIGLIAMPALAGLLILVGIRTFKPHDVATVWRTGATQAAVLSTTFTLTLLIPLQYAVLAGVALAVVLYVARQSNKVVVRRWIFKDDSSWPIEEDAPVELEAGEVVVLAPYGSLFFAAAPVFEAQLPAVPDPCPGTVVILRLRGKDELGSTFIRALTTYARRLEATGAALMLVGVGDGAMTQLEDTGALDIIGADRVYRARSRVGDSLNDAMTAAAAWSAGHRGDAT